MCTLLYNAVKKLLPVCVCSTPNLDAIIQLSKQRALEGGHSYVFPEHLALALLQYKSGWAFRTLHASALPVTALQTALESVQNSAKSYDLVKTADAITLDVSTKRILTHVLQSADELVLNHAVIGYVLLAILKSNTQAAHILHKFGLTHKVAKALAYCQLIERP